MNFNTLLNADNQYSAVDQGKTRARVQMMAKYERIPADIYENPNVASRAVARTIADLIQSRQQNNEPCVLGLATGSTPVNVYKELVRLHKEENLSFKNVVTFNLYEYYPISPESPHSYLHFMNSHLFDHVDIKPENIHYPDGTLDMEDIPQFCEDYEKTIDSYGGLDLQLLGIGRTGHIGFNEPGSRRNSYTRLITLNNLTRVDTAEDLTGVDLAQGRAITMGIGSILKARRVILMAFGEKKADIVKKSLEGNISEEVPATFLQEHPNAEFVLDTSAASELTRVKTPWLVDTCEWDDRLIRRAVIWLCQRLNKPILKLTTQDYNSNGLSDPMAKVGSAYNINIKVFNDLQHTITGWPGGKPNADDSQRPERKDPAQKRVIVFSPHPDDDVISMGGTLHRLIQHKHQVHVAYQTSGNIAVSDDSSTRYLSFMNAFKDIYDPENVKLREKYEKIKDFLENKTVGEVDIPELRNIKRLIRKGEAKSACHYLGLPSENVHFLNMPFYETGEVEKAPLSDEDVNIIVDLLREVKPHQIYAAGDLSDPHGTHRICLSGILKALEQTQNDEWMKDCYVWFYRGAWQEWDIEQIDMAVPISPEELMRKRESIYKHQTQKEEAMFPGSDSRQFWQRAEDRNRDTAHLYDELGLAEYEAIEAFVRYIPQ